MLLLAQYLSPVIYLCNYYLATYLVKFISFVTPQTHDKYTEYFAYLWDRKLGSDRKSVLLFIPLKF